jgi:YHS domain-containing protein/mono/diheme cytochrome c family protein
MSRSAVAAAITSLALASPLAAQEGGAAAAVDFVKDIQPILRERCVKCHGPDKQKGDLRLDLRSAVFGEDEDLWPIVPQKPEESILYERITLPADDPDIMPNEGEPLTKAQIDAIRRWIAAGAVWPAEADAEILAAAAKRREREVLEVRELTPDEQAAEAKALEVLQQRGAIAARIAANTKAVEVNLSLVGGVADQDLTALRGLEPTLLWLNLARTGVTDEGLAQIAPFAPLQRLNLSGTAITDRGLASLAGLSELRYLNLYGTKVTDQGLRALHGLQKLDKVFLWQTGVTDDGAAGLQAALPHATIDLGKYAELLAAAPALAQAQPVNAKCPVSGKDVDPAHTAERDGQVIAFCCDQCLAKFTADPSAFLDKVEGFVPKAKDGPKPVAQQPVNTKCPVSGKDIDPAATLEHDGRIVAFCCANCRAKFEAEPAKFAAKLEPAKKKKDV